MEQTNIETKYEWLPFFLNPEGSMPDEGEDLMEHLTKKYGPGAVASFENANSPLKVAGRACGVTFENSRKIMGTLKPHCLMTAVKREDNEKANQLMEAMMLAYFEKGRQINNIDVLKDCVSTIGLEWTEAYDSCLKKDSAEAKQVYQEDDAVKRMRVSGVPFFIVDRNDGGRPIAFSGAQPVEVISEALEEASATD